MSVALGSCERIYRYGLFLFRKYTFFCLFYTMAPVFRFFSHEVPASRASPRAGLSAVPLRGALLSGYGVTPDRDISG